MILDKASNAPEDNKSCVLFSIQIFSAPSKYAAKYDVTVVLNETLSIQRSDLLRVAIGSEE